MIKKKNYFTCFIFFCRFIFLLGPGSGFQKKPGAGAAWKKSQEPEPLKN